MLINPIEPMQVDIPAEDNENTEEAAYTIENPTLDLEQYANSYTGYMRLARLKFIADHCESLRHEALRMAITYVMSTSNVVMYQLLYKTVTDYGVSVGPAAPAPNGDRTTHATVAGQQPAAWEIPQYDPLWLEARSKKSALKLEKLDNDLKNYKSNSLKESVRRTHDDLGDHYLSTGDFSSALKCYSRSRDYCTSCKHVVNMCLNVIRVSVYLNNWSHVLSFVTKAENTPDFADQMNNAGNAHTVSRLKCTAGLAEMVQRNFKLAAKHFLQVNIDNCDFPDLISPSNVAVYGGLCALATFDRKELHKLVLGNSSFKLFLELETSIRDIITKFYESNYASCLRIMDEIRDNLLLDMFIAPHVMQIYTQIRNRALVQYFSPYMSADMTLMAAAFNRSAADLENEVMQLILDGQINARIDSHNKVLYAKEADMRGFTFEKALSVGRDYQRRTRMIMLRTAVLKNHINVKVPPRDVIATAELCPATGSNLNFRN